MMTGSWVTCANESLRMMTTSRDVERMFDMGDDSSVVAAS